MNCSSLSNATQPPVRLFYFRTHIEPEPILQSLLASSERLQAEMLSPTKRLRFLASRVALRLASAQITGCDPTIVVSTRDHLGKLVIEEPSELALSLSYSGQLGMLAIGLNGEIGVDIEVNMTPALWQNAARRHFSVRESQWVYSAQPEMQPERFLHVWTRKEAYLKCVGLGIRSRLSTFCLLGQDRFDIDLAGLPPCLVPGTQVHLHSFIFNGSIGALACTHSTIWKRPNLLSMAVSHRW